jgi:DNA polymerase-4
LFVITPRMGPAFVETLPVTRFHGVGPSTAAKMNQLGIYTGADLRRQTRALLTEKFGKAGDYYYAAARGDDDRPVIADGRRKSIGAETTFETDLAVWHEVPPVLAPLLTRIWTACRASGLKARTVTVKVKYADFQQVTCGRSIARALESQAVLEELGIDLLRPLFPPPLGVRLLGVTLSNFDDPATQPHRQLALRLA